MVIIAVSFSLVLNNHCATPFLGWITPIQKRHGYTPDISAFLNFRFYEPVYYKIHDQDTKSPEEAGRWVGVDHNVGDKLSYHIYCPKTGYVITRSLVRTADPNRGAIINRTLHPEDELVPPTKDKTNSGGSPSLMMLKMATLMNHTGHKDYNNQGNHHDLIKYHGLQKI